MNPTYSTESSNFEDDEMAQEYRFDYSKAKPNRFASSNNPRVVILDEDVAKVFDTPSSVNKALRSLIQAAEQNNT